MLKNIDLIYKIFPDHQQNSPTFRDQSNSMNFQVSGNPVKLIKPDLSILVYFTSLNSQTSRLKCKNNNRVQRLLAIPITVSFAVRLCATVGSNNESIWICSSLASRYNAILTRRWWSNTSRRFVTTRLQKIFARLGHCITCRVYRLLKRITHLWHHSDSTCRHIPKHL